MLSIMGHSTQCRVTFIFIMRIQNLVCTISIQKSILIDDRMKDFII